jgi:hypothetical protein
MGNPEFGHQIGGKTKTVEVTPTISTSEYAAGDAIGGKMTLSNATTHRGNFGGMLQTVTIIDKDKEGATIDIFFFDTDFTATADNSAFDPSDADLLNCVGVVQVGPLDWYNCNDNAVACVRNIGLSFTSTSEHLYAQAVIRTVETFTAVGDLTFKFTFLQD